jgi:hypothetical protein
MGRRNKKVKKQNATQRKSPAVAAAVATAKPAQPSASPPAPAQNSAPIVPPIAAPAPPAKTGWWPAPDRVVELAFAFAIVLFTAAQVYLSKRQSEVMVTQSKEMVAQREEMAKQTALAKTQSESMVEQSKLARDQMDYLQNQRRPWLWVQAPRLVSDSKTNAKTWKVSVTNSGGTPARIFGIAFCRLDVSVEDLEWQPSDPNAPAPIPESTMDYVYKHATSWNGEIIAPQATIDVDVIGLSGDHSAWDVPYLMSAGVTGLVLYHGNGEFSPKYSTECFFVFTGDSDGFQMVKYGNNMR